RGGAFPGRGYGVSPAASKRCLPLFTPVGKTRENPHLMSQHVQPSVGEEVAGYRLEGLAGRGGMGEVYRAFDGRLGRYVALKVLVPRLADDEGLREPVPRGAPPAARVDPPHVISGVRAGGAGR